MRRVTALLLGLITMLVINAKVDEGGFIEVGVVNGCDRSIPGCSRGECDTFRGDNVCHVVTWKAKSTVPQAKDNQFRKLRFFMLKASLYSFQIVDPSVAQEQLKFPGTGWKTSD